MTAWLDDGDVVLHHGDALEQLALMPSESVQCIVTSPPFWGLRDYGTGTWEGGDEGCDHLGEPFRTKASINQNCGTGQDVKNAADRQPFKSECGKCGARRVDQQIGLEETPDEWCARLVAVMREARRVLRSDGVCWIEVGDTYANAGASGPQRDMLHGGLGAGKALGTRGEQGYSAASGAGVARVIPTGVKAKDLVGAPWLLAFALRADGWYLRSDTIWARPNPMPESVTDRPTKAHSYVFLLTKSARYYYDADAVREGLADPDRQSDPYPGAPNHQPNGSNVGLPGGYLKPAAAGGRNARSVWSIPTEPTPFAHFATFPQALVERCIKAGTSEHGACSECGAPWRRITEQREIRKIPSRAGTTHNQFGGANEMKDWAPAATLGWEPSCECRRYLHGTPGKAMDHPAAVVPCVVLDPFMGSGTTALVARRLGRHATGVELNLSYLEIASKRLEQLSLFAEPTTRGTTA